MTSVRTALGALGLTLALAGFTGTAIAGNGNGSSGSSPGNSANAPGQQKQGQAAQPTASAKGNSANAPGQQKQGASSKQAGKSAQAPGQTKQQGAPATPSKGQAKGRPAFAASKGQGHAKTAGHKVIICHRTGSATNPYVVINISINAWQNGHQKHPALDGRSDILLQDPASPGEKLPDAKCGGQAPQQKSGQQQTSLSTQAGVSTQASVSAAQQAAAGGVLGAVATTKPTARPAAQKPAGGVLGAVATLGKTAAKGTLPFTGMPLWIAALVGLALIAVGLGLRKRAHIRA